MDYLTPAEIAERLRVDVTTVQRWIRSGQLPAIRVGRQYRVENHVYQQFIVGKWRIASEKTPGDPALIR